MIPRFRAWLKKEQKMDNDVDHISWLEDELYCIGDGITYMVSVEDLELMQSTGLVDKNCKEIFEGDILCDEGIEQESEFVYVTVSYREGMWVCDQITDELCGYGGALNEFNNDYSIIGNIYENPELLEDKE